MSRTPVLSLLFSTLLLVGCGNGMGAFSFIGLDQKLELTGGTNGSAPDLTAGEPTILGDAESGGEFTGTMPDPPESHPVVPSGDEGTGGNPDPTKDDDGDGINNDEDELPGVCTEMVVVSTGTSSAVISLNGEEIFVQSDFKNKDVTLTKAINLKDGSNALSIRIAGSPGDQLLVQIYNCSTDPSTKLFETVVTRTKGSPNTGGGSF
ncbi:MAG: hypothetical protein V1495_02115 [Pseudomonadota bacterium]